MPALSLLLIQIAFGFTALGLSAGRIWPWLRTLPRARAIELLLWTQVPRSAPLGLLAPGQVVGVEPAVMRTIAWGDFACAALALLAIAALRARGERGLRWVWLFTVVSCADIVTALAVGLGSGVYERPLGVGWFVLALYVPFVCVSQAAIGALLLARDAERDRP